MTATLANLITNDNGLRVFCDHCQHVAELDIADLARRYGGGVELPDIGKRARCRSCGGLGGSVQVIAVRW